MGAIKRILDHINPAHDGVVPKLAEAAEYFGASYAFGYVQNKYREKASVAGIPADLVVGGLSKAVAIGMDLWGSTKMATGMAPFANVIGNAGIAAFGHTLGAGAGAKASGVRRLLISESDVAKAKAALPNATILGEIPKAPHGDFLSSRDLASMAAR